MTKSTIADERVTSVIERLEHFASNLKWTDVRGAQDLLTAADGLRELQKRRKAEAAWKKFQSMLNPDDPAAAQPAPVAEREPIAWLNDAYLARGVVDGEAGSEDAGPGYIPVYREAQPAPVEISDDMAYAFHHAMSDSSLGADEVEEIKIGLRAAFANIAAAQPTLVVPEEMPKGLAGQIVSLLAHNIGDKLLTQKIWNACRAAMSIAPS